MPRTEDAEAESDRNATLCDYCCKPMQKPQSCSRGGRGRVEDMCHTIPSAEAGVDESDHHTGFCTVCLFVVCNRHWFNQVRGRILCAPPSGPNPRCQSPSPRSAKGRTWGLPTLRPYPDAGCAELPLASLGAPASIGEIPVTLSPRRLRT